MNEASSSALPSVRSSSIGLALLRATWSVLVPALLALVAYAFLVPTRHAARGTWAEPLAKIGDENGIGVALIFFVGFSLIARYWGAWLPGLASDAARAPKRRPLTTQLLPIACAALLAVVLRGVFFGSYRVLSASMLPTLEPDDRLGGDRMAYGFHIAPFGAPSRAPARGDIVVFDRPAGVEGPDRFVKRVIGLPGDRIGMNGPHPIINGWEVPSCDAGPYVYPLPQGGAVVGRLYVEFLEDRAYLGVFAPGTAPLKTPYDVKPGEVFVLGDNRSNSSDSRSWNQGRGGGLRISNIEARIKWWLLGVHRNGRVDFDHLGRSLELQPRLEGIDTSPARDAIANCLSNRPSDTKAPETHAAR